MQYRFKSCLLNIVLQALYGIPTACMYSCTRLWKQVMLVRDDLVHVHHEMVYWKWLNLCTVFRALVQLLERDQTSKQGAKKNEGERESYLTGNYKSGGRISKPKCALPN